MRIMCREIWNASLLLALLVGVAVAQPSVNYRVLNIDKFLGLQQNIPCHLMNPGSCLAGESFDYREPGYICRSRSTTVTTGPISGVADDLFGIGYVRKGTTDNEFEVWVSGEHDDNPNSVALWSQNLYDDGAIDWGRGTHSWTRIDHTDWTTGSPYNDNNELGSFTDEELFRPIAQTMMNGIGLFLCKDGKGILKLGAADGAKSNSVEFSHPLTSSWLGSPPMPTAGQGTAGNPDGTYRYRLGYCFSAFGGVYSKWSKASSTITVSNHKIVVNITDAQTYKPTNAGAIRLARTKDGGSTFYLLDQVSDGSNDYTDNTSDTALPHYAISPHDTVGYPPRGFGVLACHNDRLFAAGDTYKSDQSGMLWYSEIGDMDDWLETNYIEPGSGGGTITGLASFRDALYVFRRTSIWRLSGYDDTDWNLKQVINGAGCDDGRSIAVADDEIIFHGNGTYWSFNGIALEEIGKVIPTYGDDPKPGTYVGSALIYDDKYRYLYDANSDNRADIEIQFDLENRLWSRQFWGLSYKYPTHWLQVPSLSNKLYAAGYDGYVVEFEQGHNTRQMYWLTPIMDFGEPDLKKNIERVTVVMESPFTGLAAVTLRLYFFADKAKFELLDYTNPVDTSVFLTSLATGNTSYQGTSITTGVNRIVWNMRSETFSRSCHNCAFMIREYGADDGMDLTKEPPKFTNIVIEYRMGRRNP